LAAVGVVSVFVQGFLLGRLLKRMSPQRLAVIGLVSSTLAYAGWGAASEGWMMYAVVFANLLGFTVTASLQSIVSGAADERSQGQTMGAVSALNSFTAVVGPVLGASILTTVSHLPQGHWGIGAPMFVGALLQGLGLWLAWSHFKKMRRLRQTPPTQPAPAALGGD